MKRWHVVGIGGATCSGKSTLSVRLRDAIPDTVLVNQDQYFLPENSSRHKIIPELNHANWELITSVDMDRLLVDVNKILGSEPKGDIGLLIVEGIVVLNHKPIAELCDQKFFLTLTKDECFSRRRLRSYDPPDPPNYFDVCVWPMYEKHYNEILRTYPDLVTMDGTRSKDEIFAVVYEQITHSMAGKS